MRKEAGGGGGSGQVGGLGRNLEIDDCFREAVTPEMGKRGGIQKIKCHVQQLCRMEVEHP